MSHRRFSLFFLLFVFVLAFAGFMSGQSVTVQGTTQTVTVPMVLERFTGVPAQVSPAQPNSIPQPSLEKSLQEAPAPAANTNSAAANAAAQANSLTAPGPVLGQVFDVQSGFITPSDAGIGAGPNHLVYGVNEQLEVYNKSGGNTGDFLSHIFSIGRQRWLLF